MLAPLAWYPRLLHGTATERNDHQLIGERAGIHWPQLDADISVEGILAGRKWYESKESFDQWLAPRRVLLNGDFDQDKSISGLMRRSICSPVR